LLLCAAQMTQIPLELTGLTQRCSRSSSSLLEQMLAAATHGGRLPRQWVVLQALNQQQQMPQQPRCSCLRALLLQLAF
jgi:hypothetical protein